MICCSKKLGLSCRLAESLDFANSVVRLELSLFLCALCSLSWWLELEARPHLGWSFCAPWRRGSGVLLCWGARGAPGSGPAVLLVVGTGTGYSHSCMSPSSAVHTASLPPHGFAGARLSGSTPLSFGQMVAQSPCKKESWMEAWCSPVVDWFQKCVWASPRVTTLSPSQHL